MTEQNKISSDVEATVGSEQVAVPSQGRRRLVKGLIIATPAIMTIRRGYAGGIVSITDQQAALNILCSSSFVNQDGTINPGAPIAQSFVGHGWALPKSCK